MFVVMLVTLVCEKDGEEEMKEGEQITGTGSRNSGPLYRKNDACALGWRSPACCWCCRVLGGERVEYGGILARIE